MRYIGIDYSITSPAIAVFETGQQFSFQACTFHFLADTRFLADRFGNITGIPYPVWKTDEERHEKLALWTLKSIGNPDKIGIEGYSFGSKGKVFHLAENCGLMKWHLYKQNFAFEAFAPTVIKKFATGKGNANKDAMYAAFVQETSVRLADILTPKKKKLGSPVTDIVDAYYILKYTLAQDGLI